MFKLLQSDGRRYIPLSTFGFYQGGYLDVQLINFHATPEDPKALVCINSHSKILNKHVVWF